MPAGRTANSGGSRVGEVARLCAKCVKYGKTSPLAIHTTSLHNHRISCRIAPERGLAGVTYIVTQTKLQVGVE